MARKLMTFRDWARAKGDTWWRGPMKAAGFSNTSRVTEAVYNEATGRVKEAPPEPKRAEKPKEVTDADHGQRA